MYGASMWLVCQTAGVPWQMATPDTLTSDLVMTGSVLALYRILYRAVCVGRHFGAAFAIWVPARVLLANVINSLATLCAIQQFAAAKWRRQPLRWLKTTHEYPTPQAIVATHRQRIGEILVLNGYITRTQLDEALQSRRPGVRLGERLIQLGYLEEPVLYEALSLQTGLPQYHIDPATVVRRTGRSLPAHLAWSLRLIPVRAGGGELMLAGPELPTEETEALIRRFTNLRPRFWLVTPTNFERLAESLL
jgi:adsorption protein B